MTRHYRLFVLLLGLVLACAGLPAHACPAHGSAVAGAPAESENPATDGSDCPFHAAQADNQGDAPSENAPDDAGCCFFDCGCGCSAPVPGPVGALGSEACPDHSAANATTRHFDPSPSPERLLRPPQSQA
ncbi:hypothetical protein G3I74_02650 [Wenzhouxiangella sp. C33]|uniref:Secreted protein n=1 Tax=Wenzhouxiangella limi TaxID=2707351 RepID=A0A845USU6_9GAMM|nr:hypothetical protein [Wenzhouxiangella limi]